MGAYVQHPMYWLIVSATQDPPPNDSEGTKSVVSQLSLAFGQQAGYEYSSGQSFVLVCTPVTRHVFPADKLRRQIPVSDGGKPLDDRKLVTTRSAP